MSNRILIVDQIATNRIMLKVNLKTTQYQVFQAASAAEAISKLQQESYALVISHVDLPDEPIGKFLRACSDKSNSNPTPILVYGAVSAEERLTILNSGAEDVFPMPVEGAFLVARIRSIIRAKNELRELRLRDETQRALGFHEPTSSFTAREKVMFVGDTSTYFNHIRTDYLRSKCHINRHDFDGVLSTAEHDNPPAAFLLDVQLPEPEMGCGLLSELRARHATLHSVRLARIPKGRQDLAARALELGAHETFDHCANDTEIWFRLRRQLAHKRHVDRLRKTLHSSVQAAITDPLTGVYNRRYAMSHITTVDERSKITKRPFSVMVLDVDHFKQINDTFGHHLGDIVLREICCRVQKNVRAVDLLARVGGEEFLIILPDCVQTDAEFAAERLRQVFNARPFAMDHVDNGIKVTASIGVVMSDPSLRPIETHDLIELADTALYAAKRAGRNTIRVVA